MFFFELFYNNGFFYMLLDIEDYVIMVISLVMNVIIKKRKFDFYLNLFCNNLFVDIFEILLGIIF